MSQAHDESGQALKVSEIFASIQGEGVSAGQAAAFLRLAGCNLHCAWCDTKYTWDWQNFSYQDEVEQLEIAVVRTRLLALTPRRLVITGGEPLLQQQGIAALLSGLTDEWLVEVETNGTIAPQPALLARVAQWNVSPKLAHASDPAERRIQWAVLHTFRELANAWLKIVVQQARDLEEIERVISGSGWPKDRVLLMPEASDARRLQERAPLVAELSLRRGYGVSPRLHVERWNGRRGV